MFRITTFLVLLCDEGQTSLVLVKIAIKNKLLGMTIVLNQPYVFKSTRDKILHVLISDTREPEPDFDIDTMDCFWWSYLRTIQGIIITICYGRKLVTVFLELLRQAPFLFTLFYIISSDNGTVIFILVMNYIFRP